MGPISNIRFLDADDLDILAKLQWLYTSENTSHTLMLFIALAGWDLKISRLRWVQLSLHYITISDLEQ
jgi:hypothetical protein